MITQTTATDIAIAYGEIAAAEKLLADVKGAIDKFAPADIRDAYGRRQGGLQLGVPSGESGRRLFHVDYKLAIPIIEAHIANQRARVALLCEQAVAEMRAGGQA